MFGKQKRYTSSARNQPKRKMNESDERERKNGPKSSKIRLAFMFFKSVSSCVRLNFDQKIDKTTRKGSNRSGGIEGKLGRPF